MTRPPDRLLSTVNAARTRTAIGTLAPGGNLGQTRRARAVQTGGGTARQVYGGSILFVFHGDDPNVERPIARLVRWIGATYPVNRILTDDWLNVTLTDDEIAGLV